MISRENLPCLKLVAAVVVLFVVSSLSMASPEDHPIIEIGDGRLMGTFAASVSGKVHAAFRGIPYAQAPVI